MYQDKAERRISASERRRASTNSAQEQAQLCKGVLCMHVCVLFFNLGVYPVHSLPAVETKAAAAAAAAAAAEPWLLQSWSVANKEAMRVPSSTSSCRSSAYAWTCMSRWCVKLCDCMQSM